MALFKKPTASEPQKPVLNKPAEGAIKPAAQSEPEPPEKEPEMSAAQKPGDSTTETKTADPAGQQSGRIKKVQQQLEKLIEQQKKLNEKIKNTRKSVKEIEVAEEKKSQQLKQRVLFKYGMPLLKKEGFQSMGKLYEIIDSGIKSQQQRKLLGLDKNTDLEK